MRATRIAQQPADGTPETYPVVVPQPVPPVSRERPARRPEPRQRPRSRPATPAEPDKNHVDEYAYASASADRDPARP